jgi:sugar lactone lactonase YvrE
MPLKQSSRPDVQILMTGLIFPESPHWHDDRLWFSHWGAHEVIAVDPAGRSEVILRMPSFPLSIDWSPDGRLFIISGTTDACCAGTRTAHS